MSSSNENFAILERRLRLGLTQKQVGDVAGCGQARVSRAERGQTQQATVLLIHETLLAFERQRETVELAQTEEFWRMVGDAPHRDRLIARIEAVARILLERTLADAGLGLRLLDCLPATVRSAVLDSDA